MYKSNYLISAVVMGAISVFVLPLRCLAGYPEKYLPQVALSLKTSWDTEEQNIPESGKAKYVEEVTITAQEGGGGAEKYLRYFNVDRQGNIYLCNPDLGKVRKFAANGSYMGTTTVHTTDGNTFSDVDVDHEGNIAAFEEGGAYEVAIFNSQGHEVKSEKSITITGLVSGFHEGILYSADGHELLVSNQSLSRKPSRFLPENIKMEKIGTDIMVDNRVDAPSKPLTKFLIPQKKGNAVFLTTLGTDDQNNIYVEYRTPVIYQPWDHDKPYKHAMPMTFYTCKYSPTGRLLYVFHFLAAALNPSTQSVYQETGDDQAFRVVEWRMAHDTK